MIRILGAEVWPRPDQASVRSTRKSNARSLGRPLLARTVIGALAVYCGVLLLRSQLDAAVETIERALAKCNANTERLFEAELFRLKA